MARISDAVLQGLMNPQFGFTGLAEPIGMLMGGAQAQRQAQQRQMEAIQGALGAQDIGGLQGVLGGLRTPEEAQTALSAFGAGQQARQQQAELAAQEAAAAREKSFRDMVKRTAPSLGAPGKSLLDMVDTADIEDLRESFGTLMKNFNSNEGILTAFEIPPEEWPKYLSMESKPLLNLMVETQSFGKGTPRDYRTPDGRNVTYVTNARGQVRVPGGTWSNIEDLGLQPAVRTTASMDALPVEDIIGKKQTENLFTRLDAAEASLSVLENNKTGQEILSQIPEGSLGILANVGQMTRQAKIALGFANPDEIKTEADLNAFLNSRGQAVARQLATGTYGAGSAISDADRQAAKELAGQDIKATPETLRTILYLERKLAYEDIKRHNENIQKRLSRLSPEQSGKLSPVFEVELPTEFFAQPENYVKKYTDDKTNQPVYEDMFGVKRYANGTEYK